MKVLGRCGLVVIWFGVVVAVSLVLQSTLPAIAWLVDRFGYDGLFVKLFNEKFTLPMDAITTFWSVVAAVYVGVDRLAFSVQTFTSKEGKTMNGNQEHLKHVIVMSFVVYALAVALNLFFDADLGLLPLFTAFGSSVTFYVGGNKVITGVTGLNKKDLDEDGIEDDLQDAKEVIERFVKIAKAAGKDIDEEDVDKDGIKDIEQDSEGVLKRLKERTKGSHEGK